MDTTILTDEACERLLSGRLHEGDADLLPVRWFLEDLTSLYGEPVPAAVRALHPSITERFPGIGVIWPKAERSSGPHPDLRGRSGLHKEDG